MRPDPDSGTLSAQVRPYRRADRAGVRHVCCETGCMGEPVERLFNDRATFADYFTAYYTDWEPQHALVAEADGAIVGYVLACLRPRRHRVVQPLLIGGVILPRVLMRLARGAYDAPSRRFLRWVMRRARAETPAAPADWPHFHFNLLPAWRDGRLARALILPFIAGLPARGVTRLYGQIQMRGNRRSEALFERFGFRVLDRRPVTRFESIGHQEPVWVATVAREFGVAGA